MSKYKVEMNGFQIQDCEKLSHQQTMQLLDDYHQSHDEKIKETIGSCKFKIRCYH